MIQHVWYTRFLIISLLFLVPLSYAQEHTNPPLPTAQDGLNRLLQRYPEADLDRDGSLTREEMRRFREQLWKQETAIGDPIDRSTPEAKTFSPIDRAGEPTFSEVYFNEPQGQYVDLWLPRYAVPPSPVVIIFPEDNTTVSKYFRDLCLNAGIAVGVVQWGTQNDNTDMFEAVDALLSFFLKRAISYGVKDDAFAIFSVGTSAAYAFYGALRYYDIEGHRMGIRCAVALNPTPRKQNESPPTLADYLEINYPEVANHITDEHNPASIALLYTEEHKGDPLHHALRQAGIDALVHHASEGEKDIHLLRMALLFIQERLMKDENHSQPNPDSAGENPQ